MSETTGFAERQIARATRLLQNTKSERLREPLREYIAAYERLLVAGNEAEVAWWKYIKAIGGPPRPEQVEP